MESFETPQPMQPVAETKSTNWPKIVLIAVLGFGLLAGSAYAGYWYGTESANLKTQISKPPAVSQPTPTPTPTLSVENETIGWQTYTNQDLGFSVDYPQNWQANEFSRDLAIIGKSKGVAFRPIDSEIVNESWGLVTIEIEDNPNNLTTDNFINNYLCGYPGSCASTEKAIPITVSGVKGKKVINPPAPVPSQVVVLVSNNKIFTIVVNLDMSFEELYNTQQKEQIFNQILSTFKLLD